MSAPPSSRPAPEALAETLPAYLRDLAPYVPGKPIDELEREYGIRDAVKLASNENPLGPSPRALEAAGRALRGSHLYPDGSCFHLRAALAARFGVGAERVLVGNGSCELITLLGRLMLRPGDEAVIAQHAFAIYEIATRSVGATPVIVPARAYGHDPQAMARAVTPRTRVVFLANPNNPTGTWYRRPDWERLLDAIPAGVMVVCDDAYAEFVDDPLYPDAAREPDRHPRLVVLRTFSKIHGLAGFRVGYGIAPAEVVALIDRLRDPFNVSLVAQEAAIAALDDAAHVARSRAVNFAGRRFLERACRALQVPFVPGQGNFLMIEVGDGRAAYERLLHAGIIVRPLGGYGLPAHVRVSVGLPAENTRFVQALAALLGVGGPAAATLVQPPVDGLEDA